MRSRTTGNESSNLGSRRVGLWGLSSDFSTVREIDQRGQHAQRRRCHTPDSSGAQRWGLSEDLRVMGNCWFKWRNVSTFNQSPNSNPVEEIEERRGGSDLLISSDNRQVENLHRVAVRNPPIAFTSEEMKSITRPNSRLGGGGFGSVYEGFISKDVTREEVVKALSVGDEPLRVAVKVHDGDNSFQGHKEWLAEVIFLGQLSHPNLVKLIGYCCEGDKRILVYEYMPLGNVEEKLFTTGVLVPLSWPVRMKIAIGAARGLAFLHGARQPIIYRDFKTSNILLDHEYNAKLSDFGLAKDGPVGDESHVSTRVMGTYGYAAPEYVMTGHLTAGSDVYGFGVVLLELLTGRRTLDMARPAGEQNLVEWAVPMLKEKKKLVRIIDPRLEANYPTKGVHKAAMLAHCCLNRNPKARPTMRDVVYSLEPLQLPVDATHSIIKSPTEC